MVKAIKIINKSKTCAASHVGHSQKSRKERLELKLEISLRCYLLKVNNRKLLCAQVTAKYYCLEKVRESLFSSWNKLVISKY